MEVLVFVYGTLMRGASNHDVLDRLGARFVRRAVTRAPRTLVDLGPYPALLPADPERDRTVVEGELHTLPASALGELDAFEGCPTLYRREPVELDGEATAESYVLARKTPRSARVLANGRYEGHGKVLGDGATPEDLEGDLEDDGAA